MRRTRGERFDEHGTSSAADLVGGRDGVLVISRQLASEIAEQGYEEQLEAYVSTKIHAGAPLWATTPRVTR